MDGTDHIKNTFNHAASFLSSIIRLWRGHEFLYFSRGLLII